MNDERSPRITISCPELLPSTPTIDTPGRHPAVLAINTILGLPIGCFNGAVLPVGNEPDGPTLLLTRHVKEPGKPDMPDIGSLALAVMYGGAVLSFTEIWRPEDGGQGDLLEDARAMRLPNGQFAIGLTRLARDKKGRYLPFPGFCTTTPEDLLSGKFPDTHHVTWPGKNKTTTKIGKGPDILRVLSGKNLTPFEDGNYMFRPETDDHRLVIFSVNENGYANNIQNMLFPSNSIPDWASYRLGTTMPPIWLNDHEAIFFMHGIRIVGANEDKKYSYSIGSARLFKNDGGGYSVDNISPEPLLTPESFTGMFPNEQVQLRPKERDALYLCGGIALGGHQDRPETIRLIPNLGDTRTLEALIDAQRITNRWLPPGQTPVARSIAA